MPFYYAVPQGDGTKFQWVNCGCAMCRGLLLASSTGRVSVSSARIRRASGDRSGGIEGDVLAETCNRITDMRLVYTSFADRAMVRDLMEQRAMGFIIDTRETAHTRFRTNDFIGNHWVWGPGGAIDLRNRTTSIDDPGTTRAGFLNWPLDLLFDAAERAGGGRLFVMMATPSENVNKTVITPHAAIRSDPSTRARRIERLDKGESIHVLRTRRGGQWPREDGTMADGWHVVRVRQRLGFIRGDKLRAA